MATHLTMLVRVRWMVERSEEGTGSVVEETIGDVAYGDGVTRQASADAGRPLVARLPLRPQRRYFPNEYLEIDLETIELINRADAAGTLDANDPLGDTRELVIHGRAEASVAANLAWEEHSDWTTTDSSH